MQTNDPNNAALAEVSREFTGKLLERARAAVALGKPADADIALAKRFGADPKDIIAVQQAAERAQSAGRHRSGDPRREPEAPALPVP